MSARKVILFVIAAALLVLVLWLQLRPSQQAQLEQEMMTVVVAGRDIPPYTILSQSDLTTGRVPPSQAVGSYDRVGGLVGKMLTDEVRRGNVVLGDSVVDLPANWSNDMLIASFYVPTARIIGGQLRRGHFIDVMVTRPESQEQFPEARWLVGGLWVADVRQASGAEVLRPTAAPADAEADANAQPTRASGLGLGGFSSSNTLRSTQGPANLVVIAAQPDTVLSIADYLGARLYDPWVVVRPGGGVPATVGRIDGIAFNDVNENLFQERNERGLDGVEVTLSDERGVPKQKLQTVGGGRFAFDKLDPGAYFVEAKPLDQYEAVSTQKLQLNVAAGQNQYVIFAQKKIVPTPEPDKTPLAMTLDNCQQKLTISDRKDGTASVGEFKAGTSTVWAIVQAVAKCEADTPVKVEVYHELDGKESARAYTGVLRAGSDALPLEIRPSAGTEFKAGRYAARLLVGTGELLMDSATWSVLGPVPAATGTPTIAPTAAPTSTLIGEPKTGADLTAPEAKPQTQFGFGRGN